MARPRLDVYVAKHCFGCPEARRLARAAAASYPTVSVRIVDLEAEPDARPDDLLAVPTYVLDGRVVSLGNPRQSDLFGQLDRALVAAPTEEERHGAP